MPLKPCIIIEDPNGKLPIKLDRSNIEESKLPFEEELRYEMYLYFVAQLLITNVEIPKNNISHQNVNLSNKYGNVHVFYSKAGYSLSTSFFISKLFDTHKFYVIETKENIFCSEFLEMPNSFCLISDTSNINDSDLLFVAENTSIYVFDRFKYKISLLKGKKHGLYIYRNPTAKTRPLNPFWKTPLEAVSLFSEVTQNKVLSIRLLGRNFFKISEDEILKELLELYIGNNVIIPYDLKEREKLFPKAFKELKKYMRDDDKISFNYN